MFVALVPTSLDNLTCMRLILLYCGISEKTNIVVYVEVEQRPRLPTRLVHDEVIKCVVMWHNQVLLDVHQVVHAHTPEFWELLSAFLEESRDVVSLLALCSGRKGFPCMYHDALAMSTSVPIRISDLNLFTLHLLLFPEPLLSQLLPLAALGFLALPIR